MKEGSTSRPSGEDSPDEDTSAFVPGFPVGFWHEDNAYLYNHLRITVAINPQDVETTKFHVVSIIYAQVAVVVQKTALHH